MSQMGGSVSTLAPRHQRDPKPARVFIIDELPIVQEGVRVAMLHDENLLVIGAAGCLDEALAILPEANPDVVVTDVELGDEDVARVVGSLTQASPGARILVLTGAATDKISAALSAGVQGCVSKRASPLQIAAAVGSVSRGDYVLSTAAPAPLEDGRDRRRPPPPALLLSGREARVMQLLARGLSNRAIATELHVSQNTVRFHVHRILQKLGCRNRTHAVVTGMQTGLLSREAPECASLQECVRDDGV